MSEDLVTGVCKWFDPTKGWGFITLPGGGVDVFVHINQLRKSGITDPLNEGDKVKVKLVGVDPKTGKFKLSRKALLPKPQANPSPQQRSDKN